MKSRFHGRFKAAPGSIEQKIGNLYKSGMDDAAIEKAGFDPIKPKLAEIDQLKNGKDVASFLNKSFAAGDAQVFQFGAGADFQHADTQIGYTFQSGPLENLGLLAQVNNLTDEPFKTFQNGDERQTIDFQRYGRTFLFGASYKF